jgi:hypothetical protein
MAEAPQQEPEWVRRMRAAGYDVRVGSGEPMSEIPEVMFDPPVSRGSRIKHRIRTVFRGLFHLQPSTGHTTHAPLP